MKKLENMKDGLLIVIGDMIHQVMETVELSQQKWKDLVYLHAFGRHHLQMDMLKSGLMVKL